MNNDEGWGYVGTIFVGHQPVRVLFDTGSDYLAVTSSLCLDSKLGMAQVGQTVFDPVEMVYKPDDKDTRKCKTSAYDIKKSAGAKCVNSDNKKLDYGSAILQGQLYQDSVCVGEKCTNFNFMALF